jgi:uncharacterized Zn finger protein
MDFFDWNPYVRVAARRQQAAHRLEKLRKKGHQVSPVRIEGRKIATTFWGKAWCGNLERYSDYSNRLPRGRTYVRNGSVIDLQVAPGTVTALVSGSDVYDVRIDVANVSKARWRAMCRDCTGAIHSVVELLQGRLSSSVMARICEPKTGLLPRPKEISFHCSCPDWASMCKHVAAVLYGIGARLDERPELLFLLRSVDQQDLIAKADTGLRSARKGPMAAKVLDTGDLSQIFGIEMAQSEPAPMSAPRRKRPVRDSALTSARECDASSRAGRTKPVAAAAVERPARVASRPPTTAAASSAMTRAAVSARMKAYWRERRKRER